MDKRPDFFKRLFHAVSNVRPIVWISIYLLNVPLFAFLYWLLPAGEFRIPDGGSADFWSWLYYSIVTLTTLGFGDYTPTLPAAQIITAVEVLCGLTTIGFFLNAVGSMKSDIIIETEQERQRLLHQSSETEKLKRNVPIALHTLNTFLAYCHAVTTPYPERIKSEDSEYNPNFRFADMADLYKPSGLPADHTSRPAVEGFLHCLENTSLYLDSLQQKVDLSLWPRLLEDCFSFVANTQMFSSGEDIRDLRHDRRIPDIEHLIATTTQDIPDQKPEMPDVSGERTSLLAPFDELFHLIRANANAALRIETALTRL